MTEADSSFLGEASSLNDGECEVIFETDDGQLQVVSSPDDPGKYFLVGSDGAVFPVWNTEVVEVARGALAIRDHWDKISKNCDEIHVCREHAQPVGPPRYEEYKGDDTAIVPSVCQVCGDDLDVHYVQRWADCSKI